MPPIMINLKKEIHWLYIDGIIFELSLFYKDYLSFYNQPIIEIKSKVYSIGSDTCYI